MYRSRWMALLGATTVLFGFDVALSLPRVSGQTTKKSEQLPDSKLSVPFPTRVDPPAALIGAETEWKVSGNFLSAVDSIEINDPRVSLVSLKLVQPAKSSEPESLILRVRVDADAEPGGRLLWLKGPRGISHPLLIRLDTLPTVARIDKSPGSPCSPGVAVFDRLQPRAVHEIPIQLEQGERVTLDLEARRIGAPFIPVLMVLDNKGRSLAIAQETPGLQGDCRLSFRAGSKGVYHARVHDALYEGGDGGFYRLRIDPAPFATGWYPVAVQPGGSVDVELSGGSLDSAVMTSLSVTRKPGGLIDPSRLTKSDGSIGSPGRFLAGRPGSSVVNETESGERLPDNPPTIAPGTLINGRMDRPGDVDRFAVAGVKGQPIQIQVASSILGSRMDSLLLIRDPKTGKSLAENDDGYKPGAGRDANALIFPPSLSNTDSALEFLPDRDGVLWVELTDRYGGGGPGYSYAIEVGPPRPRLTFYVFFGNLPTGGRPNRKQANPVVVPGSNGVFNLVPGSSVPVNFQILSRAFQGTFEVKVEGLPAGVSVAPVVIRATNKPKLNETRTETGNVVLKVAPDAPSTRGEFRLVLTATPKDPLGSETTLTLTAEAAVRINQESISGPRRSVVQTLTQIPVMIVNPEKSTTPVADSPKRPMPVPAGADNKR